MKALDLLRTTRRRLQKPGTWGAILVFALIWNALRWSMASQAPELPEAALPLLLGAALMALSPWPWQWTGNDATLAGPFRGLLQAVPFIYLLVFGILALVPLGGQGLALGHGPQGGRGRGPGAGLGPGGPPTVSLPGLPPISSRVALLGMASLSFGLLSGWILAGQEQAQARADALDLLARKAQGEALQSRMNPHVFFNTLSGLAELAREHPAETEAALLALADLMRRLLQHTQLSKAPLAEERALLEGFLSLEQLRLGDRLTVRWAWDRALEDTEVPPLLLQPLVENAIKHGIAPARAGGEVEIGLASDGAALHLWVSNTGRPLEPGGPEGTGIRTLRQRLALLAPLPGRLQIRSEGGRTVAELRLEGVRHA